MNKIIIISVVCFICIRLSVQLKPQDDSNWAIFKSNNSKKYKNTANEEARLLFLLNFTLNSCEEYHWVDSEH
jgi:hypothetical protein